MAASRADGMQSLNRRHLSDAAGSGLFDAYDEITDGRGFEPLLFHIQAELWRQRPLSEGCGGEIPEKTKKNLSQS